ncbi:MAG: YHS domain-containing protein, partial [Polyangia bacterium]
MSIGSPRRRLKAALPLRYCKLHFTLRTYMAERDPVCGMMVDPVKAAGQHEHKGTVYYFCNPSCLARFKAEPDKFLAPSFRPMGMAAMGLIKLGGPRLAVGPAQTAAGPRPAAGLRYL